MGREEGKNMRKLEMESTSVVNTHTHTQDDMQILNSGKANRHIK